jgi:hypothetical protein
MHYRSQWYILDGRKPVPVDRAIQWAQWLEGAGDHRIVAQSDIGDVHVSTVFIGLDHNFGTGEPHIFETMVFGPGDVSMEVWRGATWRDAEFAHMRACEGVRASCD